MSDAMRVALLVLALTLTAPLHAQIYKWVDAKGVTHYSDKPPAGHQARTQLVEERISVVPSDPALSAATAAMRAQGARQAELAQAEWLQRQRLMLAAQAMPSYSDCPYRMDCDWPYAYRYGYAYAPFVSRAPRPPRPAHHGPPRPMPMRSSRL